MDEQGWIHHEGMVGMTTITVATEYELSDSWIDGVIITAFEGGINYWADEAKVVDGDYKGATYAAEVPTRGGAVLIHDYSEDEWHTLTLDKMVEGIKAYFNKGFINPNAIIDDYDASDADCMIQLALFGEIVYG